MILTVVTEKTRHVMPSVVGIYRKKQQGVDHFNYIFKAYKSDGYRVEMNGDSGFEVYDEEGLYAEFSIETFSCSNI